MNIVLIDTSYIFKRVCACEVWCKKAEKTFCHDTVENNFKSSIKKLSKRTNVEIQDMILCRDSCDTWRHKLYPKYKEKRVYSGYGPYIKELYRRIEPLFKRVVKVKEAEADDIIAVLAFYFLDTFKIENIFVVSNDKDFFQLPGLFKSKKVKILDTSTFKEFDTSGFSLEKKIFDGDPSDGIKKLKKNFTEEEYLLQKQLIDLSYTPRYIQDEIFRLGLFEETNWTKPLRIQLGFACINTQLREEHIFCSRIARLKTIEDKGLDFLKELVKQNVKDLIKLIKWNHTNGIRFMRISSELMPHFANPKLSVREHYTFDFVQKDLEEAGRLARLYKQRLTFHPGQFNILSTDKESVFQSTVEDLRWHADTLDIMGMDQNSVLIIHGGGLLGNKEEAIKRFIKNFKRLPLQVKRRLVLENCEKCYNIEDVLRISSFLNIPVIFDTHHFECYKKLKGWDKEEADYYIPKILETWSRRGIKPKFHISEQRVGARVGAHSDYVECIPKYLLEIPDKYGVDIDIMIEAKMKEKSVIYLYDRYPQVSPF